MNHEPDEWTPQRIAVEEADLARMAFRACVMHRVVPVILRSSSATFTRDEIDAIDAMIDEEGERFGITRDARPRFGDFIEAMFPEHHPSTTDQETHP